MGQEIPDRQNGQVVPVTPLFLLNIAGSVSQGMCPRQLAGVLTSWRVDRSGGGGAEGRTGSVAEIHESVKLEQKGRKKMSPVVCTASQPAVKANAAGWSSAAPLEEEAGEQGTCSSTCKGHPRELPCRGARWKPRLMLCHQKTLPPICTA